MMITHGPLGLFFILHLFNREPGVLDAIILSHFIHPRNAVDLPERIRETNQITTSAQPDGLMIRMIWNSMALVSDGNAVPARRKRPPTLRPLDRIGTTQAQDAAAANFQQQQTWLCSHA